jgi:5-formyl-3-hydroxy-2-methylpyridine 4-carboxylate dehydrogenase
MGPGMAATLARGGLSVQAYDISTDAIERAKGEIKSAFEVLDRMASPAADIRGEITFYSDLAQAVSHTDLVIEAIPENAELKATIFAEIDRRSPASAILASNTSGIPITKIQEAVRTPERVVGMHWSNPPHVIPMIEIIAGAFTSTGTVENLKTLVSDLGLLPVVVKKDVPGFVENRVLYAIMRECLALVDDGVIDPADLDTCVRWGIGYKLSVIGPLELLDVAGLDIYEAVGSYLNGDLNNGTTVSETITSRTRKGELGMKTGKGIYNYTPESISRLRRERAAKLVSVRHALEAR